MRQDDLDIHEKVLERKLAARQRLIGSTLLGLLGLLMLYRGDFAWGMAAVLLGFGIASVKDVVELRK
jgi:hypothetical protein